MFVLNRYILKEGKEQYVGKKKERSRGRNKGDEQGEKGWSNEKIMLFCWRVQEDVHKGLRTQGRKDKIWKRS